MSNVKVPALDQSVGVNRIVNRSQSDIIVRDYLISDDGSEYSPNSLSVSSTSSTGRSEPSTVINSRMYGSALLSDLIKYLILQSNKVLPSKYSLTHNIDQTIVYTNIAQQWPDPQDLLKSLLYGLIFFKVTSQQLIEGVEMEVKKMAELTKDTIQECKLPFQLLYGLIQYRINWLPNPDSYSDQSCSRSQLDWGKKIYYYRRKFRALASQTYPAEILSKDLSTYQSIQLISLPVTVSKYSERVSNTTPYFLSKLTGPFKKKMVVFFSELLMNAIVSLISRIPLDRYNSRDKSAIKLGNKVLSKFDVYTWYFSLRIYRCSEAKDRAKLISFLIKVAQYCFKQGEHNTAFIIITTVCNSGMQGLGLTNDKISTKINTIRSNLAVVLGIEPVDNYAGYRKYCQELQTRYCYCFPAFSSRIIHLWEYEHHEAELPLSMLKRVGSYLELIYKGSASNFLFRPIKLPDFWNVDSMVKTSGNSNRVRDKIKVSLLDFVQPYQQISELMVNQALEIIKQQEESIRLIKNRQQLTKSSRKTMTNLELTTGLKLNDLVSDTELRSATHTRLKSTDQTRSTISFDPPQLKLDQDRPQTARRASLKDKFHPLTGRLLKNSSCGVIKRRRKDTEEIRPGHRSNPLSMDQLEPEAVSTVSSTVSSTVRALVSPRAHVSITAAKSYSPPHTTGRNHCQSLSPPRDVNSEDDSPTRTKSGRSGSDKLSLKMQKTTFQPVVRRNKKGKSKLCQSGN